MLILQTSKSWLVTLLRADRVLLDAANLVGNQNVPLRGDELRGDERVIVIDPENREPARTWQLPALAPRLALVAPSGTSESVELRCAAILVDIDRGKLSVFWRASVVLSRRLSQLAPSEIRVSGGFLPGAPASSVAQDLAPPPRSPVNVLPIVNATRLQTATFPWQLVPPTDVEILVIKGTFDLVPGEAARLADEQQLLSGERFHEGGRSLAYPGDFVPYKPRADVLVQGHAYAKPGAGVARVELTLGPISANLVVMGPRTWLPGGYPSEPAAFQRIPLRYDHAFGGPDFPENPAGVGLAEGSSPPSIELTDALLRKRGERPHPAGFGPIARDWAPRRGLLGTFTKDWLASRWPYLPEDSHPAFWNTAPAALTAEALRGDETFRITSVREGGVDLEGRLPGIRPRYFAERAGHEFSEVRLRLDTVLIDADRNHLVLVWRGAIETSAARPALHRLLLVSEPLDAPLATAEILSRVEMGSAVLAEKSAPSAAANEIGDAVKSELAARRTLPRAPATPNARPASTAALIFGTKPAPRTTRDQVERWIAAGESLAGRDLSGADLSGIDLSNTDLSRAILRGTILDDAILSGVKAEGLRATGLVARRSRWTNAQLSRADLTGAILDGADLSGASVEHATLADAELTNIVARHVAAASAQLVRARMTNAILDEANLKKADLSGATLNGTRLSRAQLDDAKLYEALGKGLIADDASLVDARFEAARLDRASFRNVNGRGSMWERASLADSDFTSADLSDAGFAGADLTRARLPGADLSGARLRTAVLAEASFARANLMRANLEDANAASADFTGANLYQAETRRARLNGAKLGGAFTKGTKHAL